MRKAQSVLEYIVAIILFVVVVIYMLNIYFDRLPEEISKIEEQELCSVAEGMASSFLDTSGEPNNWESGTPTKLGFSRVNESSIDYNKWTTAIDRGYYNITEAVKLNYTFHLSYFIYALNYTWDDAPQSALSGGPQAFVSRSKDNKINISAGGSSIKSNIVALWHMDEGEDNSCADGKDICDVSGNGNNGAFKGAGEPAWTSSGKFDYGLDFDGSDDYVNTGNDSSLSISGDITIGAWIKPANVDQTSVFLTKGDFDTPEAYGMAMSEDNFFCGFEGIGDQHFQVEGALTADSWHHLVCIWNGTNVSAFINGVEAYVWPGAGTLGTTTDNLTIGHNAIGGDEPYPFNGTIDEVVIYNRALSSGEVQEDYAGTRALFNMTLFFPGATSVIAGNCPAGDNLEAGETPGNTTRDNGIEVVMNWTLTESDEDCITLLALPIPKLVYVTKAVMENPNIGKSYSIYAGNHTKIKDEFGSTEYLTLDKSYCEITRKRLIYNHSELFPARFNLRIW